MSPNVEPNNPKHVRRGPVSKEYILEETEMVRRPYEYKSMPGLTPEAERAMNEVLKEMDPNPLTPTVVKKNLGWRRLNARAVGICRFCNQNPATHSGK